MYQERQMRETIQYMQADGQRRKAPSRRRAAGRRRKRGRVLPVLVLLCMFVILLVIAAQWLLHMENTSLVAGDFTFWGDSYLEDCPQELLDIAKKNSETEEFVRDYAKEKDKAHVIDLSGEVKKGEIPLFMQWDKRWGYEYYGDEMIAINGCGPTCLSMVACGLSGNTKWSPLEVAHMAEKGGYCVSGSGSSWSLMSEGAEMLGLNVHKIRFQEDVIIQTLREGMPIICIMGPGDFTTTGHFIVLCGVDKNGKIEVRDPFRRVNSEKKWDIETIMSQTRDLWAYTL